MSEDLVRVGPPDGTVDAHLDHLYETGTRIRSWLFTICRNVFLRQKERERSAKELLDRTNADGWPWERSFREEATDPEAEFFHQTIDHRAVSGA